MGDKKEGRWEAAFQLQNVAVHASLLYTGEVLYWGRRTDWKLSDKDPSMNEQKTTTYLLNLNGDKPTSRATNSQPKDGINLFCSGHCFQPDGTLIVVGGHVTDGHGVNQACVYHPESEKWVQLPNMNDGRWYPSALTLPDGSVFCMSGSSEVAYIGSRNSQVWNGEKWLPVAALDFAPSLYPKMHLGSKGQVFVTGPQPQLMVLENVDGVGAMGKWDMKNAMRPGAYREYAPSVMYAKGKVIFVGGGVSDKPDSKPTNLASLIDLNETDPKYTKTTSMNVERTQHNATVLPDGTVLVTGGTKGWGFNSQDGAQHQAELWDPETKKWTDMAKEDTNRCYHSTALLLPDGRVLSAGSGEGGNAWGDTSHANAQIFNPPYLCTGTPRPVITLQLGKSNVSYGEKFDVNVVVTTGDSIKKVSWVRLGSVTHCANMNQSLMFLDFDNDAPKIKVHAPSETDRAFTPPGHYMLFVLNQLGVPSKAQIMHVGPPAAPVSHKNQAVIAKRVALAKDVEVDVHALNQKVIADQARPAVAVCITPACPYGLGPCWAGAYHGLEAINDVDVVRPLPSQDDSLAFVYLKQDVLPDIDVWTREFETVANQTYTLRGIEMTLSGLVTKKQPGDAKRLALAGTSTRPELFLAPFQADSKIEWDREKKAPKPMSDAEAGAYDRLFAALVEHSPGVTAQVTGRLQKHGDGTFSLDVRKFKVDTAAAS